MCEAARRGALFLVMRVTGSSCAASSGRHALVATTRDAAGMTSRASVGFTVAEAPPSGRR